MLELLLGAIVVSWLSGGNDSDNQNQQNNQKPKQRSPCALCDATGLSKDPYLLWKIKCYGCDGKGYVEY